MFLLFLTLSVYLSCADEMKNIGQTSTLPNYVNDTPYNIHEWVEDLQLETCALIAIGLKYFAIFVEDITESKNVEIRSTKYFLGICQQSVLEEWEFCSKNLSKKRKHKCKFNLGTNKYHGRVHRRFCDIRLMLGNKDCLCEQTIFGDEMYKVIGFPTCYIPPLPSTLCKYNVCGVSQCTAKSVENTVHTVECDSKCRGGNPFCEYPLDRSARVPAVKSLWSKWREHSTNAIGEKLSVASCINTFTGEGDLDCLGPGYACCGPNSENCSCHTFEETGVLRVQRIIQQNTEGIHHTKRKIRKIQRYQQDTDDDMEDDDDEEDIDEDIVLEETLEDEDVSTTTTSDSPEKEEMLEEIQKEIEKEMKVISKNNTLDKTLNSKKKSGSLRICHNEILSLLMINVFLANIFWS